MQKAIVIIYLFFGLNAKAQDNFVEKWAKRLQFGERDTNYIKPFAKEHNLQINTWLNSLVFFIDPPYISGNTKNNISLSPNLSPQVGISLGLRYFSASLNYNLPVTISNIAQYGKTSFFDLGLSYYRGFVAAEMNVSLFKGLYQNQNRGNEIIIKKDANLSSLGLNVYYVFNHKKFSFRSAIKMQELQYKSAGSFILMASTGYKYLNAPLPFVSVTDNSYGLLNNVSQYKHLHFSIRPGYAHNFSFKKGTYFIKPALFIGAGFTNLWLQNNASISNNTITADYGLHSKLALGYNGPDYFFNIYTNYDATLNRLQSNNTISFNQAFIGFNAGYRFNTFSKKYKWL